MSEQKIIEVVNKKLQTLTYEKTLNEARTYLVGGFGQYTTVSKETKFLQTIKRDNVNAMVGSIIENISLALKINKDVLQIHHSAILCTEYYSCTSTSIGTNDTLKGHYLQITSLWRGEVLDIIVAYFFIDHHLGYFPYSGKWGKALSAIEMVCEHNAIALSGDAVHGKAVGVKLVPKITL
jgi:hypothetical protein